jgi:hypothetical protein
MRVWKRVPSDYWTAMALFVDQAFHVAWITAVVVVGR